MKSIIGDNSILLPNVNSPEKWAVVACDQFTSELSYWTELRSFVGDAPSTLNLIYPEIYLNDDKAERIAKINACMEAYLDSGIFYELPGFVLVEREFNGQKRIGLVLSVDLEAYDWNRVKANIRATEDTIVERLPVRLEIRKEAKIELPHILLLIDDERKEIIESVYADRENLKKLYDFDLNMGGGHLRGYAVEKTAETERKLYALLEKERQIKKYGDDFKVLFAVGDGNHSLATAKVHWERLKATLSEEEMENHPARYALVEVINIYDDALSFEPIHRVVFSPDDGFIDRLKSVLFGKGKLKVVRNGGEEEIDCPLLSGEAIKAVQDFLEKEIRLGLEVDYVHGEEHVVSVINDNQGAIGLLMPPFAKDELFDYVLNVGNLPKKAFSIGDPEEKKYYMEAKRIK